VLGDTPIESRYSDYRDFGGVRFPTHIVRTIANLPWYDLTVSAVRVNSAATFTVPAEIAANPAPSVGAIEVTELAPGVFNFGGGTHNSVIIEQSAGVIVVEAPLNEQRSEAVIARVREKFPGRRITAVINTHAHFDHAGGLRTYVDEGIPVIAQARNATYYQRAWAQPRTINPDRLAKSRRMAKFRVFDTRLDLPDAVHPIEIHTILGSGHNDAFAMVYLPADKILIEADAWTPTPQGSAPSAVPSPLWINLHDNVVRLKLDVQRVQPLHGSVQDFVTFKTAAGLAKQTG
jgi:glyoxylase-like metal-dependent hydrolase (beta-lactamase superfamily II)